MEAFYTGMDFKAKLRDFISHFVHYLYHHSMLNLLNYCICLSLYHNTVDNNQLTGTIPAEICAIEGLFILHGPEVEECASSMPSTTPSTSSVPSNMLSTTPSTSLVPTKPWTDNSILEQLFVSTVGENWAVSTNWREISDECTWFGVECLDGRVNRLDLGEHLNLL